MAKKTSKKTATVTKVVNAESSKKESFENKIVRKLRKFAKYIQTTPVTATHPTDAIRCKLCKHVIVPVGYIVNIEFLDDEKSEKVFSIKICRDCCKEYAISTITADELYDVSIAAFPVTPTALDSVGKCGPLYCNVCQNEHEAGYVYYLPITKRNVLPITIHYCEACYSSLYDERIDRIERAKDKCHKVEEQKFKDMEDDFKKALGEEDVS